MWIQTEEGVFNTDQLVSMWEEPRAGETMATDQTEAVITISKTLILDKIIEALRNEGELMEVPEP